MNVTKRVSAALILGVVAGAAVLGASEPPQNSSRPVVLQRILVKVNGMVFTKTDLEERQVDTLQQQNQTLIQPADLQNDAKLREALIQITPQILAEAVDELIMLARGRDLGLRMSDEQFKTAIDNVKKENQWDEATFQTALKQQGLSMEALRTRFNRSYVMSGVQQQEIGSKMQMTEEEVRQYYRAHPEEFMKPPMVTLREIFIAVPTETRGTEVVFNQAVDEAAQAKIAAIRERALRGEDYVALVTETSESGSKANGGLIGPINLNELAESLRSRLEPLKAGDITEPLRTPKGYQLLKIEARTAAEPEPYEAVRAQVGDKVYQARLATEQTKYLEGLRGQAIIEWKDEELKTLYEKFHAERKKSN